MSDPKKYTENTEVTTETKRDSDGESEHEYQKKTTVKTERTVKEEKDPVVIIEES